MTMTIENGTGLTVQEIAKRRIEYENKRDTLKTNANIFSNCGGITSGFSGFILGALSFGGVHAAAESLEFATSPVKGILGLIFDSGITRLGVPAIVGLGVAIGGGYLFYKNTSKNLSKDLNALSKQYADVLTPDEIKEYKLDVHQ